MICIKCNDIIEEVEVPVKVTCYLMMCQSCRIEYKINERNLKLGKVLGKSLFSRIWETLLSLRSSLQKSATFFCKILC
jgi:hypothetical protein